MRRQYSLRQFHAMPTLISCLMVGYVYFSIAVYIPYLAPWHSRHWVTAMYVLSPLAASLTLASYLQAVLLDPGAVPPDWNAAYRRVPFCGKCNEFKPPRTHHCSHCHRCVLRYDHHCEWIDNCVGLVNHKLFFLFLFYICIAIAHYHYLVVQLALHVHVVVPPDTISTAMALQAILAVLFTIFIIPFSFLGVFFLLWTTYLIVNNQTSLENGLEESHDAGLYLNLVEVLGDHVPLWFLPTPLAIPSDLLASARSSNGSTSPTRMYEAPRMVTTLQGQAR
jgi:hypothetical protein